MDCETEVTIMDIPSNSLASIIVMLLPDVRSMLNIIQTCKRMLNIARTETVHWKLCSAMIVYHYKPKEKMKSKYERLLYTERNIGTSVQYINTSMVNAFLRKVWKGHYDHLRLVVARKDIHLHTRGIVSNLNQRDISPIEETSVFSSTMKISKLIKGFETFGTIWGVLYHLLGLSLYELSDGKQKYSNCDAGVKGVEDILDGLLEQKLSLCNEIAKKSVTGDGFYFIGTTGVGLDKTIRSCDPSFHAWSEMATFSYAYPMIMFVMSQEAYICDNRTSRCWNKLCNSLLDNVDSLVCGYYFLGEIIARSILLSIFFIYQRFDPFGRIDHRETFVPLETLRNVTLEMIIARQKLLIETYGSIIEKIYEHMNKDFTSHQTTYFDEFVSPILSLAAYGATELDLLTRTGQYWQKECSETICCQYGVPNISGEILSCEYHKTSIERLEGHATTPGSDMVSHINAAIAKSNFEMIRFNEEGQ